MAGRGVSRKDSNRAIRQQALREQLATKGLLQQALAIADKLEDLATELDQTEITRLKAAAELKFKAVAKYLPDLKAVEVTGEDGGPMALSVAVEFVDADKN